MAKINLRLRIVHTGKEIKMGLAPTAQGTQVIKSLLSNSKLNLVKMDQEGQPLDYKLTSKATGKQIGKQTLAEAGVKDGDTLLLHQNLIAG